MTSTNPLEFSAVNETDELAESGLHADPRIRQRIASHAATPDAVLAILVHDTSWEVRAALLDNPHLSETLHAQLAVDPDASVRYAVAECYNLSAPVVETLCADENPYVASRARQTEQNRINAAQINCSILASKNVLVQIKAACRSAFRLRALILTRAVR